MFVTIGEALVDLIEQIDGSYRPCLGGCICNVTIGLARQQVPVTYLNALSADRFGDRFVAHLQTSGAALAAPARSAFPTSLAMVGVDSSGVPSYAFYRDGVADRDYQASAVLALLPADLTLLHTGGLALAAEDSDKLAAVLRAVGAGSGLISIDANLRPFASADLGAYLDSVRAALAHAHIIKVSDEDLIHMGLGDLGYDEAAQLLLSSDAAELVAITLGAKGAILYSRQQRVEIACPTALTIADTVGAGDAFIAGLLAYLYRHGRLDSRASLAATPAVLLQAALRHAVASASINVTRVGCAPPTWEETSRFWVHTGKAMANTASSAELSPQIP